MYSCEDRIRAVELYIKYDLSAADTVRELGYPSHRMLVRWFREYQETGRLHISQNRIHTKTKSCLSLNSTWRFSSATMMSNNAESENSKNTPESFAFPHPQSPEEHYFITLSNNAA